MRELNISEIREIQLKVLQEFHDFCVKNDIHYSLCAGTLLGAIRHKGYIPWDDDIDVMMPRKEYQRFISSYVSDSFTVYHYSTHKSYMMSYAKLSDNSTLLKEGTVYESDYGVSIDIFPLDYHPDNMEESKRWANKLKFLKDVRTIKNIRLSNNRSWSKNIVILLSRCLLFPIPMKWLVKRVDIIAQKYSFKTSGYVGNMTNGLKYRERTPKANTLIDVEFEGRLFKAVGNFDVYLKGIFKNYMELPPVEKRVSTHTAKAYVK